MVEIVEWPFGRNFPKNESSPDRKEIEVIVLKLSNGPSISPFLEAEKHLSRALVPRHQEEYLFSEWLACFPPDFLPVLWPEILLFLCMEKLICHLVS